LLRSVSLIGEQAHGLDLIVAHGLDLLVR